MGAVSIFSPLLYLLVTHLVYASARPWACQPQDPTNLFVKHASRCPKNTGSINKTLLDRGTSGFVYKQTLIPADAAREPLTLAVKAHGLRHEEETKEDYLSFINNEYAISSSLWHPSVVQTYDLYHSGSQDGTWYQVMEHIPYTLTQLLHAIPPHQPPTNLSSSARTTQSNLHCILSQLLHALSHLHHHHIAHLDLKPSNLLLTPSGTLKLIDFGSSTFFLSPSHSHSSNGTSLPILSRGIHGTLPFLAPEILTNEPYDPAKADLWAVGVLWVYVLLGRCPWEKARLWDPSFRLFSEDDSGFRPVKGRGSVGKLPVLPRGRSRGRHNLLEMLPKEVREVVGGLLEVEPGRRWGWGELGGSEWVRGFEGCEKGREYGVWFEEVKTRIDVAKSLGESILGCGVEEDEDLDTYGFVDLLRLELG